MDTTCSIPQRLVFDIGQFIGETLQNETLSPYVEKKRSELYKSLQPHIVQENGVAGEEDYEDLAPDRACSQMSSHSSSGHSDDGIKVATVTFNEVKNMETKFGPLWRKEKGLFRDVWRKYLAGIYEQMLVLYMSDRDLKPSAYINIQGYVARPAPNAQKDPKSKNCTFEVVCPGKRNFQFFARTPKDMQQWVAAICSTSIQHISGTLPIRLSQNPPSSAGSDVDTYEEAGSVIDAVGSDEEIYDDIAESEQPQTKQNGSLLVLPDRAGRNSQRARSITRQVATENHEVEELYNDVEDYNEPMAMPLQPPPMVPSVTVLQMDDMEETYNEVEDYDEPDFKPETKPVKHPPLPPPERNFQKRPVPPPPIEFTLEMNKKDKEEQISKPEIKPLTRPPLPPPVAPPQVKVEVEEEEDIYHDIEEYQSPPPPKLIVKKQADKPPPLPARRPLPSIPKEESSEEEITYDDIEHTNTTPHPLPKHVEPKSQNINTHTTKTLAEPVKSPVPEPKFVEPTIDEPKKPSNELTDNGTNNQPEQLPIVSSSLPEEEKEELYDDVEVNEQPPTSQQHNFKKHSDNVSSYVQNTQNKSNETVNPNTFSEKTVENVQTLAKNATETSTKPFSGNKILEQKATVGSGTGGNVSFLQSKFSVKVEASSHNTTTEVKQSKTLSSRQDISEKTNESVSEPVTVVKSRISEEETPQSNIITESCELQGNSSSENEINVSNTQENKSSMVDIRTKFQQKKNNSFLYRKSSIEGDSGHVQSLLKKLQEGDEEKRATPKSMFSKPTNHLQPKNESDNKLTFPKPTSLKPVIARKPLAVPASKEANSEVSQNNMLKNGESFQNNLKKIEASLNIKPKAPNLLNTTNKPAKKTESGNLPLTGPPLPARNPPTMDSLLKSKENEPVRPSEPVILNVNTLTRSPTPTNKAFVQNSSEPLPATVRSRGASPSNAKTKTNGLPVPIPITPLLTPAQSPNGPPSPTPPELPPRNYLRK